METSALSHRAFTAHLTGIAAEEAVARRYCSEGGRVRDTRWRCPEGELDLVIERPGEIVFVEVKARRTRAAEAVSPRQWARIGAAASRYLAETTDGRVPCRFDLAVVDRSGHIECLENVAVFDGW